MPDRIVALDLGGTRLKAGVVDLGAAVTDAVTNAVTDAVTESTEGLDAEAAIDLVRRTVGRLADGGCSGIGLAVPGVVDDGVVTALPGKFPGLEGRDLAAAVAVDDLPVTVVNDAVAYAVGEAAYGAGQGARRVVVVTIGTGVGVCVIEDGAPLGAGPLGGGTLGGQIPIGEPEGPTDTSGRRGTIEARCRAEALVAYAHDQGVDTTSPRDLYAAARAGQPGAVAAVATYRGWLVRAVVALAHAHAPEVLVLGGGPIQPGAPVLDGLPDAVSAELWRGYEPVIRPASLGDHAALLGLATLVLRRPPA
ncbi:MAG TPA: ROK family protein [Nitriliruptorales bacterium]